MERLPRKLKKDAILEALCEFRFASNEMEELTLGRLLDSSLWKDFAKARLPIADIPPPIRAANPEMIFLPVAQLTSPDRKRIIRVGGNVLSYHVIESYCGWSTLNGELSNALDVISRIIGNGTFTRIGLRYVNGLTEAGHRVFDFNSLDCQVATGGQAIGPTVSLNYKKFIENKHEVTVQISSRNLVGGVLPPNINVIIDLDVSTPNGYNETSSAEILQWVAAAHTIEKREFFRLFPKDLLNSLVEEWDE